jgi:hypothetical protein
MADQGRSEREVDMTDEEILNVFRTLMLPTTPVVPPARTAPDQTVVFFPIVGNTVPLPTGERRGSGVRA